MRVGILGLVLLVGCGFQSENRGASQPGEVDEGHQTGGPEGPNPTAPSAETPAPSPGGSPSNATRKPTGPTPPGTGSEYGTSTPPGTTAPGPGGVNDPQGGVVPPVGTNGTNGGTDGATGGGTGTATGGAPGAATGTEIRPGTPADLTGREAGAVGTGQGPVNDARAASAKVLSDIHQEHVHFIALGRLAEEKATALEVKELARRVVGEHTRDDDALVALARRENITLDEASKVQNQEQLDTFERLRGLSGAAFDTAYLQAVAEGHGRSLADVEEAIDREQDPEVRAYLQDLVPHIQAHIRDARGIQPNETGS